LRALFSISREDILALSILRSVSWTDDKASQASCNISISVIMGGYYAFK
jgi:hypothetical protein